MWEECFQFDQTLQVYLYSGFLLYKHWTEEGCPYLTSREISLDMTKVLAKIWNLGVL